MTEQSKVTFFGQPGAENTAAALQAAAEVWQQESLARVVVASTTGATAVACLEHFPASRMVVVGHHFGFREPGQSEMDPSRRQELEAQGANLLFASHGLSGVGRGISRKFGAVTPVELVAQTLKLLGEGFKVCVEMAVMAADAGLVPLDRPSLFIAGTGRGADTVATMLPAHANDLWALGVPRIICMPLTRPKRD